MRLVFAGTPETAVPSLQSLLASDRHEVVAVVTRPDAPAGRGRGVARSPIGQLADEQGIEVLTPQRPDDADFVDRIRQLAPDACPVVAYGGLLPQRLLDIPRHGWINLHFSLLPAWRGAAPVPAAIKAGDEITGASTFEVVAELDAGPVYGVVTEPVRADDTAGSLLSRLAESGAVLLRSTMDGVAEGAIHAEPQPTDGVSYAPKISVDYARVDFAQPAVAVDRLVRAMTPDPGAWAMWRDARFKLGPVTIAEDSDPLPPGQLLVERKRVLVGTATRPVQLGEVQAQGKKRMAATDWARGSRLEPGECLA